MEAILSQETRSKSKRKGRQEAARINPLPPPEREEWVCRICGWHAIQESQPEECALCSAGPGAFIQEYEMEVSPESEVQIEALDEGLWSLKSAFAWGHASYLLEKPTGPILIDCPDVFTPELVDFLKTRGGVHQILYCHHHFLGAGQRARQLFSAETFLHEEDKHPKIVTVPVDNWVATEESAINGRGGEPIRGLLVGGHTPGSTFFHYDGMLFTGDAFSGWTGPLEWYYTELTAVQSARKKLADLPIKGIYSCCGHLTRGASRQILGSKSR
ncbi:MAG: hypothetical protein KJ970_07185 [Candidatus Eisenbacteria bacterium]|uniref:Metallo-beta-lactamase domain-containing protein n=1 Tax=Eiseniibacteriota bacterium TaxID=2212470 RepID=A0A948W351_UNCEI|nr:hypothetical protein [Candidatus Eisenbacteria bacterium]